MLTPTALNADLVVPSEPRLLSSVGAFKYLKTHPAFAPEAYPNIVVPKDSVTDDGMTTGVPLGFHFDFYGITYDTVTVYSNGLVMFGTPVVVSGGLPRIISPTPPIRIT